MSLRSPATLAAVIVAAACVVLSVSFRLYDPDLWQNITVGKAIWQLHRAPTTQMWSWPTWGDPDIKWTWGFSALLWPVWEHAGVIGLFAWRWITALAAFALLWAAARRMGARGLLPLVVMVLCSLVWRARSQVRPETLVAVLLALEIWILESRRHGGRDRSLWLVPIAWAWANVHNSWFLGFALMGFHLLDGALASRPGARRAGRADRAGRAPGAPSARLAWVALAALAISFVNPYGWRALWQPFDFFLHHRNEAVFKTIGELGPVRWEVFWLTGLPLLAAGWPLLLVARARRSGLDRVELMMCGFFTALMLPAQRFVGFYAIAAAAYVSRDLDALLARPAWLARAPLAARAAFVALACVAIGLPKWTSREEPLGIGFVWSTYPVGACDFIAAHGVRGRGFNQFGNAGYQVYRFWPDRSRLPFMDIHQAGTPTDRYLYAWAQQNRAAWLDLDRRHRFDYVLLGRRFYAGDSLLDALDADSTWALVFLDDVGALYVRREGPLAGVAREWAYRLLPAGGTRLASLGAAADTDSALRGRLAGELERAAAGSAFNAQPLTLLGSIALHDGQLAEARRLFERAVAVNPSASGAHERLAMVALEEGRARDALREVALERAVAGPGASRDLLEGRVRQELGDRSGARAAYLRALRRAPGYAEARDSLASLERAGLR